MNIYIAALLCRYFAENWNVYEDHYAANELAMVYLKIVTVESIPVKSKMRFSKDVEKLYLTFSKRVLAFQGFFQDKTET